MKYKDSYLNDSGAVGIFHLNFRLKYIAKINGNVENKRCLMDSKNPISSQFHVCLFTFFSFFIYEKKRNIYLLFVQLTVLLKNTFVKKYFLFISNYAYRFDLTFIP
jgi:hypothetical protein